MHKGHVHFFPVYQSFLLPTVLMCMCVCVVVGVRVPVCVCVCECMPVDVCVVYSAAEIRPLCVFHCYINQDVKKGGKCLTFTVRTSRGNTRVKPT